MLEKTFSNVTNWNDHLAFGPALHVPVAFLLAASDKHYESIVFYLCFFQQNKKNKEMGKRKEKMRLRVQRKEKDIKN